MESKRASGIGRRSSKKETAKTINNSNVGKKRKGNEDSTALRTRSGRTRSTPNLKKIVSTTRKKATDLAKSQEASLDTSSALTESKDASCEALDDTLNKKVCIIVQMIAFLMFLDSTKNLIDTDYN